MKVIFNKLIFVLSILNLFIFAAKPSYGASINLAWNVNTEADLDGYKIYYGTSSGNYGEPVNAGKVIEYELSGLTGGATYYIAITAYDTSENESQKSEEVSGVAQPPPDTQNPTITIISPTTSPTFSTSDPNHYFSGTASDNVGVTEVTWVNNRGGSGTASGTTNWSVASITMQSGQNIITFTARDAADNTGTDIITVNYTPVTTTITTTSSATTTAASTTTTTAPSTTSSTPVPTTTTSPGPRPTSTSTTISATTSTSSAKTTSTTIKSDSTPPTGTITINNDDEVTHSLNVVLTLYATDDSKELTENGLMTFSNDNEDWSDPEPYKTTKTWTLSSGEGEKTVYAIFRDAAGNWMSKPVNDQIKYEEQNNCDDPQKIQPVSLTASSEFLPFWAKDSAIDGDPLTVWSTLPSIFWKNEFITLDLGETKQISGFDMYASKMFGIDYLPTSFQIQISKDNITWEDMGSEKDYTFQSAYSDSWEFNTPEARYIKVSITKAKTFFIFYLVQIAEIEVYGCDMPEQTLALLEEEHVIKDEIFKVIDQEEKDAEKTLDINQGKPSVPGKPVVTFK
jgi:hypothetical protein